MQFAFNDFAGPLPPAAALRIQLTYLWRHRRLANLIDPTLFTELVQDRKLHDRDRRMPLMADKVAVKAEIAARLGDEWVVPTLWEGSVLSDQPAWPAPFVVKSRHGCNQSAFVRTGAEDWSAIVAQSRRWMAKTYGLWLDEWLYRSIPRGLVVEPFIGREHELPVDYKLYVFGGRVQFVQVHLDREHDHRWVVHDCDWRRADGCADTVAKPSGLPAMIEAAEEMARGFDFVRVDFYQPAAQPLFGEMSFYPGSGLDPFDPPELDALMGRMWLAARERLNKRPAAPAASAALPPPVPA